MEGNVIMARRNPTTSFGGQIAAVVRQTVIQRFDRPVSGGTWQPAVNVYELPDRVEVCVELAGVNRDRLEVHVEPGRLRVTGVRLPPEPTRDADAPMRIVHMEIDDGPFRREVVIPAQVVLGQVQSTYREGMLCITLPMRRKRGTR